MATWKDVVRIGSKPSRATAALRRLLVVVGTGVDPVTSRFSGARSAN